MLKRLLRPSRKRRLSPNKRRIRTTEEKEASRRKRMERESANSTSQSTKRSVKVRRRLLREEKMMKTILIHLKSEAVNSARTRYTSCKRTDSSWWASQRLSQKISTSNKSSMIVSTARNSIITTELAILD